MKTRMNKMILLTGILCAMSFAACACSGEKEVSGEPRQAEEDTPETGEDVSAAEPPADSEKEPSTDAAETGAETGNAAEDVQEGQPAATDASDSQTDDEPDLEGDIKELQDGKLTLVKHQTSETDDGALIVVAPGENDSGFEKVTVTYDGKTLFQFWNIYDGGDRSETEEATEADLENGQSVQAWGSFSGDEFKAVRIRIVRVK